jgi:hypothetical protein
LGDCSISLLSLLPSPAAAECAVAMDTEAAEEEEEEAADELDIERAWRSPAPPRRRAEIESDPLAPSSVESVAAAAAAPEDEDDEEGEVEMVVEKEAACVVRLACAFRKPSRRARASPCSQEASEPLVGRWARRASQRCICCDWKRTNAARSAPSASSQRRLTPA